MFRGNAMGPVEAAWPRDWHEAFGRLHEEAAGLIFALSHRERVSSEGEAGEGSQCAEWRPLIRRAFARHLLPRGEGEAGPEDPRTRGPEDQGTRTLSLAVHAFHLCLIPIAALLLSGCYRQQMAAQPKYNAQAPSDLFADGMSARPRVPGTVARGELVVDDFAHTGKVGNAEGDGFPFPVTPQVMARGRERFDIYCSECHGRLGNGDGMIPRRGLRRPPSYHTDVLRNAKTGHFFDVMTNGFGAMPAYGSMIPLEDRWAIVAYIRALQLSQNATVADVPAGDRDKLAAGGAR
jgi:mono/diheme cytochrome c family protein